MYQHKLIFGKNNNSSSSSSNTEQNIMVSDADNGGGYACVGARGVYAKSLYLPLNFVVNLKLLLKKYPLKKKREVGDKLTSLPRRM